MEAQLAQLTAWVHYSKTAHAGPPRSTPPPRSLASVTSDSSDTFPASSASSEWGPQLNFSYSLNIDFLTLLMELSHQFMFFDVSFPMCMRQMLMISKT